MSKRLLLADDSVTIQKVVELILSEENFQILSVNDGQEALDKVNGFNPSIVLADIEMPKVNGYDLAKHIKSNDRTKHIPVILLVGAFEPLNERSFKECGASDYLIKPFESQEFLNKINAVLGPSAEDGDVTTFDMPEEKEKDEEPLELGESSMMDNDDIEDMLEKNIIEETAVFEEGSPIGEDNDDYQNFSDSDLTTKELKDVLESLSGDSGGNDGIGSVKKEPPVKKESSVMDDDDIEALLAGTMAEEPSGTEDNDSQKTVLIAEDAPEELDVLEDMETQIEAHPDLTVTAQMDFDENSFKNDDVLLGSSEDLEDRLVSVEEEKPPPLPPPPPVKPQAPPAAQPRAKAPQYTEPPPPPPSQVPPHAEPPRELFTLPSHTGGNVLLTTGDVTYILQQSLSQKVSQILDEGSILSIFKESVDGYIVNTFEDVSVGLNEMVSEAINKKINEVIGMINLEVIVNQVISSTIKGILASLPAEIFKMTRDVTERVIQGVLEENLPALKTDVEKVIWETVPGVAERLINNEIEQIKAEFM
ncbi:MAG: response regulator [Nitrospirae bacterium]|nr:response regulator [Nitrospirota bacterium]